MKRMTYKERVVQLVSLSYSELRDSFEILVGQWYQKKGVTCPQTYRARTHSMRVDSFPTKELLLERCWELAKYVHPSTTKKLLPNTPGEILLEAVHVMDNLERKVYKPHFLRWHAGGVPCDVCLSGALMTTQIEGPIRWATIFHFTPDIRIKLEAADHLRRGDIDDAYRNLGMKSPPREVVKAVEQQQSLINYGDWIGWNSWDKASPIYRTWATMLIEAEQEAQP